MENKKQLEFLNTLRFLSVILIVFTHFNYQCFSHYYSNNILESFWYHDTSWLYWIFYGVTGKYAVAMMCIISGFLIVKKFYRKSVDFGRFIFNRYLRLMLPVFVTCTIYVIIRITKGDYISLSTYLNGVLWLGNGMINDHLGYILDFFIGNVLIALITYLFSKNKYFPLLYIPIMILLYRMEKIWILSTVIGGLTYHLSEVIKEKKIYKYWYLLIIIPLIWWLPRGEEGNKIYLKDTIACSIIVITFYCLPKLQGLLNWSKIKDIKKISYSLFVTHGLVNRLLSGYIVMYFRDNNILQNVYIVQIVTFLIVLTIDLIISGVIYYFVEYKLYNLINKLLSNKVNNYEINLINEGAKNEK